MVRESLADNSSQDIEKVVIAYETIWAIEQEKPRYHSTGRRDAQVYQGYLARCSQRMSQIRIYGSNKRDNIAGFINKPYRWSARWWSQRESRQLWQHRGRSG